MNDIVYILRMGKNEELRYSLRSVEKNFQYRKIWFYGGKPQDIQPDNFERVFQEGETKWQKVRNTLVLICQNDNITEDFWLFNDDFFIMEKVENPVNYYDGTLADRIKQIESAIFGQQSEYSKRLRHLLETLQNAGIDEPFENIRAIVKCIETCQDNPIYKAIRESNDE